MNRTYSPTSTEKWLRCPTLFDLSKRWEPRETSWTPNMLMGSAVHEGLARHYKGESAITCEESMLALLKAGMPEECEWTLEGLLKLAVRGWKAGVATGIPSEGQILQSSTEQDIGGGRPDVVWRTAQGRVRFADHKIAFNLEARYVSARLRLYDASWQLMDYAWRLEKLYGELPEAAYIHLITINPRAKSYLAEYPIAADDVARWVLDAEEIWGMMEEQERLGRLGAVPWRNWAMCTNFPFTPDKHCPMFALCHTLGGDERQADTVYTRRG